MAEESFRLIVDYFVGADIAPLRKPLAANFTLIWSFTGMPPFVCLQESKLVNFNYEEDNIYL
jgi:hypothetical protein